MREASVFVYTDGRKLHMKKATMVDPSIAAVAGLAGMASATPLGVSDIAARGPACDTFPGGLRQAVAALIIS
jgi:hypothetical protein